MISLRGKYVAKLLTKPDQNCGASPVIYFNARLSYVCIIYIYIYIYIVLLQEV